MSRIFNSFANSANRLLAGWRGRGKVRGKGRKVGGKREVRKGG